MLGLRQEVCCYKVGIGKRICYYHDFWWACYHVYWNISICYFLCHSYISVARTYYFFNFIYRLCSIGKGSYSVNSAEFVYFCSSCGIHCINEFCSYFPIFACKCSGSYFSDSSRFCYGYRVYCGRDKWRSSSWDISTNSGKRIESFPQCYAISGRIVPVFWLLF